jgi:hypothetical protein
MSDYVKVGEHAFMNGDKQEAIPFCIKNVKDSIVIFYVPSSEETTQKFFDSLKNVDYDITKVPFIDIPNYKGDIEKASFFTDEGKMRVIN